MRFLKAAGTGLLPVLLFTVAAAAPPNLVTEEFMVPSSQPGIQLYVRNKHPDGMASFSPERTVLFVHGATYPAETSFDLPLGERLLDGSDRSARL
jgi:hypothetical protein